MLRDSSLRRRMERGGSLLEMLTILAIIMSVIGSAAVSAVSVQRTFTLKFEVDRLRLLVERAYTLALISESTTRIVVDQDSVTLLRGADSMYSYQLSHGIMIELPTHLGGALRFFPAHATSPATINIRASTMSCSLTLSLRGRTRASCR